MISIERSSKLSESVYVTFDSSNSNFNLESNEIKKTTFSSILCPPLSEEEKEQQLSTVNNHLKKAGIFSRIKKSSQPSEQVATTSGWDERQRFLMKIFNLSTPDKIQGIRSLNNGTSFASGLSLATVEAPESTPENPVMYVASGTDHVPNPQLTWYKVYINQVSPHSATREEMFALLTYEHRNSDPETLVRATYAWSDIDPCARFSGQVNYMEELKACFNLIAKDYKGGDMRAKDAYDALMDMIERLESCNAQRANPSRKTIYHQLAQSKK